MARSDRFDPIPATPLEACARDLNKKIRGLTGITDKITELTKREGGGTKEDMQTVARLIEEVSRAAAGLEATKADILREVSGTANKVLDLPSVPPDSDQGVPRENKE